MYIFVALMDNYEAQNLFEYCLVVVLAYFYQCGCEQYALS